MPLDSERLDRMTRAILSGLTGVGLLYDFPKWRAYAASVALRDEGIQRYILATVRRWWSLPGAFDAAGQ